MTPTIPIPLLAQWTSSVWLAVGAAAVFVIVVVGLMLARARAVRRERAAEAELADLRDRVATLEERAATPTGSASPPGGKLDEPDEFVITSLGTPDSEAADRPVPAVPATAFADIVVRETIVHTASFARGVRRALSPEVRHRIRFEMKRELKRARKARKVERREAVREYRARHRHAVPVEPVPAQQPAEELTA